jgi:prevent-host-death family protein
MTRTGNGSIATDSMLPAEIPIAEAKARLSECIRRAEHGEVLFLTRRGKAAVALVSAKDAQQVVRLRRAGPEHGLASLAGGWEGSDELANVIAGRVRSRPRSSPPMK